MGTKHDRVDPKQPPPPKLLDWVSSGHGTQSRSDDGSQSVKGDGVPGLSGGDEISDGTGHIAERSRSDETGQEAEDCDDWEFVCKSNLQKYQTNQ